MLFQYCSESFCCLFTVNTCTCILLPPQRGLTALMYATLKGHSETVRVLVDYGADLNVKNKVHLYIKTIIACHFLIIFI